MSKPSNGPWDTDGACIWDADGNLIAVCNAVDGGEANAWIMMSSIELYEACKALMMIGIINPTGNADLENAKRLLTKAFRRASGV